MSIVSIARDGHCSCLRPCEQVPSFQSQDKNRNPAEFELLILRDASKMEQDGTRGTLVTNSGGSGVFYWG